MRARNIAKIINKTHPDNFFCAIFVQFWCVFVQWLQNPLAFKRSCDEFVKNYTRSIETLRKTPFPETGVADYQSDAINRCARDFRPIQRAYPTYAEPFETEMNRLRDLEDKDFVNKVVSEGQIMIEKADALEKMCV